jgi:hypothetical protein
VTAGAGPRARQSGSLPAEQALRVPARQRLKNVLPQTSGAPLGERPGAVPGGMFTVYLQVAKYSKLVTSSAG